LAARSDIGPTTSRRGSSISAGLIAHTPDRTSFGVSTEHDHCTRRVDSRVIGAADDHHVEAPPAAETTFGRHPARLDHIRRPSSHRTRPERHRNDTHCDTRPAQPT